MNPVDVLNQIKRLTTDVIAVGICDEQNFPSIKSYTGNISEIGVSSSDNSIFLKDVPYREMYSELVKKRNYNIKMIDGALISLLYRFQGNELVSHRLSFFPAPDLEVFQNEPELYSMDEMYLDILDQRVVTVPLRFDFDSGDAFIPVEHPIAAFPFPLPFLLFNSWTLFSEIFITRHTLNFANGLHAIQIDLKKAFFRRKKL